jgi:hypothetical protein
MICYHNLGEIAHDVVTACPVRIGIKKRARCCDYWEVGSIFHNFRIALTESHRLRGVGWLAQVVYVSL